MSKRDPQNIVTTAFIATLILGAFDADLYSKCCSPEEKTAAIAQKDACYAAAAAKYDAAMTIADDDLSDANEDAAGDRDDELNLIDDLYDSAIASCHDTYDSWGEPERTIAMTACEAGANLVAGEAQSDIWAAYYIRIGGNLLSWETSRESASAARDLEEVLCRDALDHACDNW